MQIDIIFFEAGSGHKTSAYALQYALLQENPAWNVRTIDMSDIFDKRPWLLGIWFRIGVNALNACMRRERYIGFTPLVWIAIGWTRLVNGFSPVRKFVSKGLSTYWEDVEPNVIITVTPMVHPLFFEGARVANPNVHCITIPVDHEEMCPGYWFYPKYQQTYLTGTQRLKEQALALGVKESEIQMLSGCVIDPRFYEPFTLNREQELIKLGLNPALKTVMISFGGQGTVNVLKIARKFIERQTPINLICLCGGNQELLQSCLNLQSVHPVFATRFLKEPPVLFHHLADVAIGKPGTLTLNEALITVTPFVFVKSTGLSPVQSGNEKWMIERGVGIMALNVDDVPEIVERVLDSPEYVTNAKANFHRGIFDVVGIIKELDVN